MCNEKICKGCDHHKKEELYKNGLGVCEKYGLLTGGSQKCAEMPEKKRELIYKRLRKGFGF